MLFIFITSYRSDEDASNHKRYPFITSFFFLAMCMGVSTTLKLDVQGSLFRGHTAHSLALKARRSLPFWGVQEPWETGVSGCTFCVLQQAGQEEPVSLQPAILLFIRTSQLLTSLPRKHTAHTGIALDSILMQSTHVNSLEPDRHCYSKTCRGGKSPKTTVYSMNFILLFCYLKTEAKWHGWKYSVKRTKWVNHSTGN